MIMLMTELLFWNMKITIIYVVVYHSLQKVCVTCKLDFCNFHATLSCEFLGIKFVHSSFTREIPIKLVGHECFKDWWRTWNSVVEKTQFWNNFPNRNIIMIPWKFCKAILIHFYIFTYMCLCVLFIWSYLMKYSYVMKISVFYCISDSAKRSMCHSFNKDVKLPSMSRYSRDSSM